MNSNYRAVTAMMATLTAGALLGGCNKNDAAAAGPPAGGGMPPPLVVTASAQARDVPVYIDSIGKAVALESVTVAPRTDGQIIERQFEDGAEVQKGKVLFLLDPAPAEAALASAKAQLAQSKASAQFAKIELDRYATVAGTNAISKSDIDVKKNAVDVADAQVAAADAAVRTAQINLDFCTVRAPITGRAGSRMVDVGNVVKQNETSLLSIQSVQPIYADFTVNEQQLADVRANMADGKLVAHVRLPGDTGDGATGQLTFLDNAVQTTTGTIRLRATLDNADRHFWPGQFVNVRLVLKTLKGAVLVPAKTTQVGQGGPFVLVVKPDGNAEQRDVVLGQQQGDLIVVEKGVAANEQVIVEGQLMVRPGAPVRVSPPEGAAPSAPDSTTKAAASGTDPKGAAPADQNH